MKKKAKLAILVVLLLSLVALVWANTGSNKEYGYTYCGGGGFIPASSLIPNNPGGPCLGTQVTKSISGRYENKDALNVIFGVVAVGAIITYLVLSKTKH